jgi:hypothetical protein
LEAYKKGLLTLDSISQKVNISKTSVSNDLRNTYGMDALEQARNDRRKAVSLERRINAINAGLGAELQYDEAVIHLKNGNIQSAGFLELFHKIIGLAQKYTGSPQVVWFKNKAICKVQGDAGCVKIRSGVTNPKSKEHSINRYRFKITLGNMADFNACIFCIRNDKAVSIYCFPSQEISQIQSLNLKFKEHENTKYSDFLESVEAIS